MSKKDKVEEEESEKFLEPVKNLYLVREHDDSEKGYYYLVYESVQELEVEGEVLVYEYKQRAMVTIMNQLELIKE